MGTIVHCHVSTVAQKGLAKSKTIYDEPPTRIQCTKVLLHNTFLKFLIKIILLLEVSLISKVAIRHCIREYQELCRLVPLN